MEVLLMKRWLNLLALGFLLLCALMIYPSDSHAAIDASNRVKINMGDSGWKFIKSDGVVSTVSSPNYNDNSWNDVSVPHSYNDIDTFVNTNAGIGGMYHGTAWYRKHFTVDAAYTGRKILIEF